MTLNETTMNLNLRRIDVCNILLALTLVGNNTEAKKWKQLHDKIKVMLDEHDDAVYDEILNEIKEIEEK